MQIHVFVFFFFPKIFGHDAVDGLFVSACGCSQKRTDAVRKAVRTFRLVWAESERLDISGFWQAKRRHLSVGGPQLETWASVKAKRLHQRSLAVAKGFVAVSLGAVYDWQ